MVRAEQDTRAYLHTKYAAAYVYCHTQNSTDVHTLASEYGSQLLMIGKCREFALMGR